MLRIGQDHCIAGGGMKLYKIVVRCVLFCFLCIYGQADKEIVFIFDLHDVVLIYNYEQEDWFVVDEVAALICQLKEAGYRLYIASNIHEKNYAYVSGVYPQLFGLFDGFYCRSVLNNYGTKRDAHYYPQLKSILLEQFGDVRCVVIDDKQKYCSAAQNHGFEALCFKSAEQLWSDVNAILAS